MRVLLADDNDVNRYVIGRFLEKWGVEYDVAVNGREAVEKVATGNYAVVLMDLQMPELSGYDAVRAIRRMSDPRCALVPVIAVSASMRMRDQEDLDAAGFSDFIGKPVAPPLLLEKLAQHRPR
jgi:CheY-like chemotaxis protein